MSQGRLLMRQSSAGARRFRSGTMTVLTTMAFAALLAPAAHARLSVSPNYRMSTGTTPARGLDTVALAVDPRNRRHIVELNADWTAGQCQHHVSFDGGRTWRGGSFPPPPGVGAAPWPV